VVVWDFRTINSRIGDSHPTSTTVVARGGDSWESKCSITEKEMLQTFDKGYETINLKIGPWALQQNS